VAIHGRGRTGIALAIFTFVLPLTRANALEAPGVVIQGTYDYVVHPDDSGVSHYRDHESFEVSRYQNGWIIRYADPAAATNDMIPFTGGTASCDGTNIYLLKFQNISCIKRIWGDKYESMKDRFPVAAATVFPGVYPPPDPPILQRLWVAFASDNTFAGEDGKVKPPDTTDLSIFFSTNYICSYYWSNDVASPDIRRLIFRSDGRILSRDKDSGKVKYFSRKDYSSGYTTGTATWKGLTNLNGYPACQSFSYSGFAPRPAPGGLPGLYRYYTYDCTVTNAYSSKAEAIPALMPGGNVLVTDRRFIDEGYGKIDYLASNWMAASDAHIIDQLRGRPKAPLESEILQGYPKSAVNSAWGTRRQLTLTAIWMVMIVPFAVVFGSGLWKRIKQNSKERNK
jgi:hypothetical protein